MLQRLSKPAFRSTPDSPPTRRSQHVQHKLDKLESPTVRNVTHHSVDLAWIRPAWSSVKSDNRLKFAIQEEDKKTKGTGTIYIGYGECHTVEGLEPLQSYKYRLKVTDVNGDSNFSPFVTVCTKKEPYNGQHLHRAVMQNNEESVLKILASGEVSIEVTDELGYTPLMNASQKGFLNIVNILLEHGADVNAQNISGRNSLMLACFIGNLEIVKRLRVSGAKWETMDRGGSAPIHWSVDSGNEELIEWIIEDGADVNVPDRSAGWTPLLRCAALSGNVAVAKILLQKGAKVNATDNDGKTSLMIATLNSHTALVKELIESGADFHAKNKYGKCAMDMAKSFDRRMILSYFEEMIEEQESA